MTELTKALFSGLLGEQFEVSSGPDGPADTLTLAEVEDVGRAVPDRDAYSLIFHGNPRMALPHDTLLVRHPAIGDQAIFLGPIARDAEKTTYQAVFN